MFILPLLFVVSRVQTSADYAHFFYPLAPPKPSPKVLADSSQVPDQKPWLDEAAKLVRTWYPTLTSLLATSKWDSPRTITLVLVPHQDAPAATGGSTISVSADWIRKHPDDFGMMIHELTHVVQAYPDSATTPGWLVEGIADYIRWWRYEPEAPRPRIDVTKATYHDAYRTTAYWLAFVSHKYDMRLVPTLDLDMKEKRDPMPEFQKLTGKTPDELWQEFIAALPKPR